MRQQIPAPTFKYEQTLWQSGFCHIAGIDEAGRGALAGPVVAAAVVVDQETMDAPIWSEMRDSKELTPDQRTQFSTQIQESALAWAIGSTAPSVIDQVNIAVATRLAMQQVIEALQPAADYLLIDWVKLPRVNLPQQSMAKADQISVSVAAASILAKTHRDALMVALDDCYPEYGFCSHKGYGTPAHRNAIEIHGPCPEHRHSFAPIAQQATLFA